MEALRPRKISCSKCVVTMFACKNHVKILFKYASRTGNCSLRRGDRYLHMTVVNSCKDEEDPHEENISGSISSKYEVFVDYKSPIIFDIEREREKFYEVNHESDPAQRQKKDFSGILPIRGETGVFDVHELVEILNKEKALDMVVIKIPESCGYVDYFVIVTGRSWKHMTAMAEYVRRLWKFKTNSKGNVPTIEGGNSNEWKALDLGNIALHIMSKSARDLYDLESLWSTGAQYDPKCKLEDSPQDYSYSSLLTKLMPMSEVP